MKFYLDKDGEIYAFEEDGSQDHLITDSMVEATPEQVTAKQSPPLTWRDIRAKRDHAISETDWMVLPDSPYKNNTEILTYRQNLRDITETYATPEDVVWPDKPEV